MKHKYSQHQKVPTKQPPKHSNGWHECDPCFSQIVWCETSVARWHGTGTFILSIFYFYSKSLNRPIFPVSTVSSVSMCHTNYSSYSPSLFYLSILLYDTMTQTNGTFAHTMGLALVWARPGETSDGKVKVNLNFDNAMRRISFWRRAYNFFRTLPSV